MTRRPGTIRNRGTISSAAVVLVSSAWRFRWYGGRVACRNRSASRCFAIGLALAPDQHDRSGHVETTEQGEDDGPDHIDRVSELHFPGFSGESHLLAVQFERRVKLG